MIGENDLVKWGKVSQQSKLLNVPAINLIRWMTLYTKSSWRVFNCILSHIAAFPESANNLAHRGSKRVSLQCEISNVSAKHLTRKMTLGNVGNISNCTVPHQCNFFRCLCSCSESPKIFVHREHTKVFSPVWTLICARKPDDWENNFLQKEQLKDFLPVWVFICCRKFSNNFKHKGKL